MIKTVGDTNIKVRHKATCHCGLVELEVKLVNGIIDPRRCNCSMCRRKGTIAALPAIRTLKNNRKVFFNQIIAAYKGWDGVNEDPSVALCFGDGSFFTKMFLDKVVSISYDINWKNGDIALLDNNLAMYGRRPYSGETKRKVLVVLGQK